MEQILYEDNIVKITFDSTIEAIIVSTKNQNRILTEEEYKSLLIHYRDTFLKSNVSKVITDFREAIFPLTEEIEQWTIDNISIITYEHGLRFIAYIYPKEVVSQFGLKSFIEKMLKTYKDSGPTRMIFSDFDKAYKWLKNK